MLRMFCFMTKHTLLGLGAFSCHGRMLPAASARSVSLNVARFEICPENRNRATKFVGSFRGFLFLAGSRGICLSVSYSLHELRNSCV